MPPSYGAGREHAAGEEPSQRGSRRDGHVEWGRGKKKHLMQPEYSSGADRKSSWAEAGSEKGTIIRDNSKSYFGNFCQLVSIG